MTTVLFVATVAGVLAAFWAGTSRSWRVTGLLVAWLAITGILAARGAFAVFSPPPPMFGFLAISLVAVVGLTVSPLGRTLAMVPLAWLVGFQVFRIPVEIVLYQLHRDGVAPIQMTFEGLNFDILSGLIALPVAFLASRNRLPTWGLVAWNIGGLALLVNIIVVSLLSLPLPFRVFMNEPANTFVATFPFAWLPLFLVPAALAGHLLVFRRLLITRPATSTLRAQDVATV